MRSFVTADAIRSDFSNAMSAMYREEVPLYRELTKIVTAVNEAVLDRDGLRAKLALSGDLERLGVESHGAIRVGTAAELSTLRRVFAVMGMHPVGYYDLAGAGVPVHSTAFRPIDSASLARNPFRVFTSLLRLEVVQDTTLRDLAARVLSARKIVSDRALELVGQFEAHGGLANSQAEEFVREVLETFRWHRHALIDKDTYSRLSNAHRLVADVVSFRGPHINHLTPRTLDIDMAQAEMERRGFDAKAVIEGPPRRVVPILLRQTSFRACEESIVFAGAALNGLGTHTARFGEIEQRGVALTPLGRDLYDASLKAARGQGGAPTTDYATRLSDAFTCFPDDSSSIRRLGLAYFRYSLTESGDEARLQGQLVGREVEHCIDAGWVSAEPIVYEDFLPVSAAGIFQSNLRESDDVLHAVAASQRSFEEALGAAVQDPFQLYGAVQEESLAALAINLGKAGAAGADLLARSETS